MGQTSRLAQYEIEVESPLRPKEIQSRIRAGETVEEIADAAGIAVERVRWFEGPVLAERAYVANQAQAASVRRHGDATPGPRLGEIVADRLKAFGADPEDAQWDAKKRGDGSWQVEITFITDGRMHTAEWIFDPRRRHVLPADDNAARMSLSGAEPPQPPSPPPGEATVTRLEPRLSVTSGHAPSRPVGPGHGDLVRPRRVTRQPNPMAPGRTRSAMRRQARTRPRGTETAAGPGMSARWPLATASPRPSRPRPSRRHRWQPSPAPRLPARRLPSAARGRPRRHRGSRPRNRRVTITRPSPSPSRHLPRPRRPRGSRGFRLSPPESSRGGQAGRRLAVGVPRCRPGTRSCSAAHASGTDHPPGTCLTARHARRPAPAK